MAKGKKPAGLAKYAAEKKANAAATKPAGKSAEMPMMPAGKHMMGGVLMMGEKKMPAKNMPMKYGKKK